MFSGLHHVGLLLQHHLWLGQQRQHHRVRKRAVEKKGDPLSNSMGRTELRHSSRYKTIPTLWEHGFVSKQSNKTETTLKTNVTKTLHHNSCWLLLPLRKEGALQVHIRSRTKQKAWRRRGEGVEDRHIPLCFLFISNTNTQTALCCSAKGRPIGAFSHFHRDGKERTPNFMGSAPSIHLYGHVLYTLALPNTPLRLKC